VAKVVISARVPIAPASWMRQSVSFRSSSVVSSWTCRIRDMMKLVGVRSGHSKARHVKRKQHLGTCQLTMRSTS
jgi:hypothetical protein